jgi:hypothetical protein
MTCQRGREEGIEEGREEGRAGLRAAIRAVLRSRQITMTEADESTLQACTDLNVLASWAERAADAESARDVFDRE